MMISKYYSRFELAYAPYFVRKRVGKCFKVIRRFSTYERALDYLRDVSGMYPGVYFDIKDVSKTCLDSKSRLQ